MDDDGVLLNKLTWSIFLPKLRELGVEIRYTSRSDPYLCREVNQQLLTTTLPMGFDPEKVDDTNRVTPWVFYSVCRKLNLVPRVDFPGWYTAF